MYYSHGLQKGQFLNRCLFFPVSVFSFISRVIKNRELEHYHFHTHLIFLGVENSENNFLLSIKRAGFLANLPKQF